MWIGEFHMLKTPLLKPRVNGIAWLVRENETNFVTYRICDKLTHFYQPKSNANLLTKHIDDH